MKRLIFKWKKLKATFWFIPSVLVIISILLSIGLVYIDGCINISRSSLIRFFFVNSSDSARIILSTISGAMIGVAGTVFSVTLVALTLASSQFGPRLIKNFMYVRLNQVVLGSYISTYLYCLLVLNAIKDNDGYTFIPSISILFAIVAAIVNIILLIIFIHQIAISIQADNMIADISDIVTKKVEMLFPKNNEVEGIIDSPAPLSSYKNSMAINCPNSGYLQLINYGALIKMTTEHEGILELYDKPGNYLIKGVKMGELYTNDNLDNRDIEKFGDQFVFGKSKTAQQDLEFSILQIVEIAVRSLSPGINDPFTAVACINNLTSIIANLSQVKFPSKYLYDQEKNIRVITITLEFEILLNTAFSQIRQFSEGNASVIISLMKAMITIHGLTKIESDKRAIINHAEMILRVGKRTIHENIDLEVLIKISKNILK